jgi:hypothetical protein
MVKENKMGFSNITPNISGGFTINNNGSVSNFTSNGHGGFESFDINGS